MYTLCLAGLIMSLPLCGSVTEKQKFNDSLYWEFEENTFDEKLMKHKESDNREGHQLEMSHI